MDAEKTMTMLCQGADDLLANDLTPNIATMDRRMCNEILARCMDMEATMSTMKTMIQHRLDTMGK